MISEPNRSERNLSEGRIGDKSAKIVSDGDYLVAEDAGSDGEGGRHIPFSDMPSAGAYATILAQRHPGRTFEIFCRVASIKETPDVIDNLLGAAA